MLIRIDIDHLSQSAYGNDTEMFIVRASNIDKLQQLAINKFKLYVFL